MNPEKKKDVWKVFKIGFFLFASIVLLLPYMVQISTFFHEKAHQRSLDLYSVRNAYEFNLLKTIPTFFNPNAEALGVTKFNFAQYQDLDKYQRTDVHIAGIVSDLRFLLYMGIGLALVNVYLFYKIKFRKEYNLIWVLAINWMLFMWLLSLVKITTENMTHPSSDIYQLIRFLRV